MQRTKRVGMARTRLSGQRSTSQQYRRVAVRLRVRPRRVGREAGLAEARSWRSGIRLCVLLAGGCLGRAAPNNAQVNSAGPANSQAPARCGIDAESAPVDSATGIKPAW